jgi:hypothetical protein
MDVRHSEVRGSTAAARVGAIIQEYAAYAQRDQRRLDDKRVRSYIAMRLSVCVRELLLFRSSESERLNGAAEEFDLGLRRLRNAIDAVTDVPVGYSTFFDAQHLRHSEADRLVAADLELIERAQGLVQSVEELTHLSAEDENFGSGCSALCERVTGLARALEQRSRLFAA